MLRGDGRASAVGSILTLYSSPHPATIPAYAGLDGGWRRLVICSWLHLHKRLIRLFDVDAYLRALFTHGRLGLFPRGEHRAALRIRLQLRCTLTDTLAPCLPQRVREQRATRFVRTYKRGLFCAPAPRQQRTRAFQLFHSHQRARQHSLRLALPAWPFYRYPLSAYTICQRYNICFAHYAGVHRISGHVLLTRYGRFIARDGDARDMACVKDVDMADDDACLHAALLLPVTIFSYQY